jgi:ABC-2 type transport system ATP-binding protein
LFNGKKLVPENIADIGYLPEERGLYKKMEVGEQALYLAQLKGMSRHEASLRLRHWFEKFSMQGWWKKRVEELSKGMQQKVQFIVTIVHEPHLLILDEPFTGFDPINANLIRDELLALNRRGTSIMLSTHRMETVEELCTHIALLNKSKKVLEGNVREIRRSFRTRIYEIEYNGNTVAFANALWSGFELLKSSHNDYHHVAEVKLLGESTPNDLLRSLIKEVEVHSMKEIIPGMHDIFISAVSAKNHAA